MQVPLDPYMNLQVLFSIKKVTIILKGITLNK